MSETQYKYRFKKWEWNKNISTPKKEAIIKYRQSRAAAGESTQLKYKGKKVDQKKLQRLLKQNNSHNGALDPSVDTSRDLKLLTGSEFLFGSSVWVLSILFGNENILGSGLLRVDFWTGTCHTD